MRRDGEEASLHRGRGEERRSADRRQSHGTATGTESTYDHRSRGKILYRVIFFPPLPPPTFQEESKRFRVEIFVLCEKFDTLKRVRNYLFYSSI